MHKETPLPPVPGKPNILYIRGMFVDIVCWTVGVAMAINSPEPVAEVAGEEGESLHKSEAVSSLSCNRSHSSLLLLVRRRLIFNRPDVAGTVLQTAS